MNGRYPANNKLFRFRRRKINHHENKWIRDEFKFKRMKGSSLIINKHYGYLCTNSLLKDFQVVRYESCKLALTSC